MKPDARFLRRRGSALLSPQQRAEHEFFWAHVRSVSEELDYTDKDGGIFWPKQIEEIVEALNALKLATEHIADANGVATKFGNELLEYFRFRAKLLNQHVKPLLMTKTEAKAEFLRCLRKYRPDPLSLTWNKQKGDMKAPAYMTCMVNMVLGHQLGEAGCDFDPQSLTTVTIDRKPFRTLARRVDGAFPGVVNPTAVWEIKEYYYTTTFGSRIADGIYESLLDALELESLEESPHGKIFHYLIIDASETWWGQGNPYLCRIIDMLHMGYLDEAIFGREVEPALLRAAEEWKSHRQSKSADHAAGQENESTGVTPPPKHRRLQPADRRQRVIIWNEWAKQNDLQEMIVSDIESEQDRIIRLQWNKSRKRSKTIKPMKIDQ